MIVPKHGAMVVTYSISLGVVGSVARARRRRRGGGGLVAAALVPRAVAACLELARHQLPVDDRVRLAAAFEARAANGRVDGVRGRLLLRWSYAESLFRFNSDASVENLVEAEGILEEIVGKWRRPMDFGKSRSHPQTAEVLKDLTTVQGMIARARVG